MYCPARVKTVYKEATPPPLSSHTPLPRVLYSCIMGQWTWIFLFLPSPFLSFFTFTKEVVVFWQQCQWDQKLQGFLLLQRGSIILSFSEMNLLKRFTPIVMISLLVFAYKSNIAKAYGYDCLNCKHQPNVCKFLLGLEAQILDTAFSSGAERCGSKIFSIHS